MKDFLQVEAEVRSGVESFAEDIFLSEDIKELNEVIKNLVELTQRYASKKNNRPNKFLKVFQEYDKLNNTRERKIKKEIDSSRVKKNYKDYLPEIKLLRERGLSFRKISAEMLNRYNVIVSSETIRNKLAE